jgi:hypothetical protein
MLIIWHIKITLYILTCRVRQQFFVYNNFIIFAQCLKSYLPPIIHHLICPTIHAIPFLIFCFLTSSLFTILSLIAFPLVLSCFVPPSFRTPSSSKSFCSTFISLSSLSQKVLASFVIFSLFLIFSLFF